MSSNNLPEIPVELRPALEITYEGGAAHIKCKYVGRDGKECGALFSNLSDAIRHLITHDNKYRKFLSHLSNA